MLTGGTGRGGEGVVGGWGLFFTISAQKAFKLCQQADGVQLPQESVIMQAVPQLDNKATNKGRQLQKRM